MFNTRFELTAGGISAGFDTRSEVLEGYEIRSAFAVDYEFDAADLDADTTVTALLADGSALPSWLSFDAETLQFIGTPPEGTTEPIDVRLTFTRSVEGSDPLTFTDSVTLDPAALAAGHHL